MRHTAILNCLCADYECGPSEPLPTDAAAEERADEEARESLARP